MTFLFGRFVFGVLLPLVAIFLAVIALSAGRRRAATSGGENRIEALEEQVRGLLQRVWTLEQRSAPASEGAAAAAVDSPPAVFPHPLAPPEPVAPAEPVAPPAPVPPPLEAPPVPPPSPPRRASIDLEQRIGARWATWVGVVAILFGIGFFLKWSFDNDLLGPGTRVLLGLVVGLALLVSGLSLRERQDVPYLSEGLAGLGLGVLYLSLYGAHAVYELIGPGLAFAGMVVVTLLGAAVAVVSNRQVTAVLTVIGGLLTPLLLTVERPDERNLFAYLLVLDLLVLAIARFRAWPGLARVAWVGTALLVAGTLVREPDPVHPLSRLALLSALFVLFLAIPLVQPLVRRQRQVEIDLLLVVANAAGYFWAVYTTLDSWRPGAEGPYALALAVIYRLVSSEYATRVPDDEATVVLHEGIAWTFLTLAIPLALSGRWITLGWAVQGVALVWAASRVSSPVAAWGGLAALLLAAARVVAWDQNAAGTLPVWNLTYLAHLLVVVALVLGGAVAPAARPERLRGFDGSAIRATLWVVAPLVLAVLFWREPPGLWPATLLTAELALLGLLAGPVASSAWLVAIPVMAAVLLARVLFADDLQARIASDSLVNAPLVSRIAACAAMAWAGGRLARVGGVGLLWGRCLSGAAGFVLLFVLSQNWTRYEGGGIGWTTQVGLSVLWTLYAGLALAWGFLRSRPPVRYAALALFGLTVLKVFVVDLAAVKTVYRILSFLVLGVVLLGVSLLYQKAHRQVV